MYGNLASDKIAGMSTACMKVKLMHCTKSKLRLVALNELLDTNNTQRCNVFFPARQNIGIMGCFCLCQVRLTRVDLPYA